MALKRKASRREAIATEPKDGMFYCHKQDCWIKNGGECEFDPENEHCQSCAAEIYIPKRDKSYIV